MIENFYRPPDLVARLRRGLLDRILTTLPGGFGICNTHRRSSIVTSKAQNGLEHGLCAANLALPTAMKRTSNCTVASFPVIVWDAPSHSSALPHLVKFLRELKVVSYCAPVLALTPSEQWLERFGTYLHEVVGSAESTVLHYRRITKRFLARYGSKEPDWAAIRPTAHRLRGAGSGDQFGYMEQWYGNSDTCFLAVSGLLWRDSTRAGDRPSSARPGNARRSAATSDLGPSGGGVGCMP